MGSRFRGNDGERVENAALTVRKSERSKPAPDLAPDRRLFRRGAPCLGFADEA